MKSKLAFKFRAFKTKQHIPMTTEQSVTIYEEMRHCLAKKVSAIWGTEFMYIG